jgi:Leu/Phe-tRNA-protein transferase
MCRMPVFLPCIVRYILSSYFHYVQLLKKSQKSKYNTSVDLCQIENMIFSRETIAAKTWLSKGISFLYRRVFGYDKLEES